MTSIPSDVSNITEADVFDDDGNFRVMVTRRRSVVAPDMDCLILGKLFLWLLLLLFVVVVYVVVFMHRIHIALIFCNLSYIFLLIILTSRIRVIIRHIYCPLIVYLCVYLSRHLVCVYVIFMKVVVFMTS